MQHKKTLENNLACFTIKQYSKYLNPLATRIQSMRPKVNSLAEIYTKYVNLRILRDALYVVPLLQASLPNMNLIYCVAVEYSGTSL